MTQIKAIETEYKGYRFRSRLEARWAVFFDDLDVEWEYEKEGFDLGEAGWYLPDFYLTKQGWWVEIKPCRPMSPSEVLKVETFGRMQKITNQIVVLYGPPVTFYDDDRYIRFEDHLTQMILCARIFEGDADIENLRSASVAARSARFEHGEKPMVPA